MVKKLTQNRPSPLLSQSCHSTQCTPRAHGVLAYLTKPFVRKSAAFLIALSFASLSCAPYAMATTAADLGLSGANQTLAAGQVIDEETILQREVIAHVLSTSAGTTYNSDFEVATAMYNHTALQDGTTNLTNNGSINFSATIQSQGANLAGIYAVDGTVSVTNNGTIYIDANATRGGDGQGNNDAYASAIYADGNNVTVLNTGSITLNAESLGTNAFCVNAYGINAFGPGTVANTGTITTTAKSDADYALAMGYLLASTTSATNEGTIIVTAVAAKKATAVGIDAYQNVGSVINYGTISATATSSGGTASAEGLAGGNPDSLTNAGTITASATATGLDQDARAYGIVLEGGHNSTLSNTGYINLSATSTNGNAYMYQAYIEKGDSSEGAYIGDWAFTLGDYDVDITDNIISTVFGVGSAGTLNLSKANLIIRADENTKYGEAYSVGNLVYVEENGTVLGTVSSVSTELPFLVATLGTSGSGGTYADQTITLTTNISAHTSPGHGMASINATTSQSYMNNLSTILANQLNSISKGANSAARVQGSAEDTILVANSEHVFSDAGNGLFSAQSENHWRAFLMPYFSHANNKDFDYNTNMVGIATGASYVFNEAFTAGFHLNLGTANSESSYLDSEALALTLGVHAMYTICPELYVRAHLSGYTSQADTLLRSTSATSLLADVDTDSLGFFASLSTGYDWKLNTQHTITPEIGLSYMYSKTDGYDVNYQVAGQNIYSMSYDDSDFDIVYAEASLRWTGEYALGNKEDGSSYGLLKPTARLGVRQALTDADVTSTMHFYGTSATTHSDANESAFIAEAGLSWIMDDVTLCFTYTGDFGDVEDIHMGMMKVSVAF